MKKIMGIRNKYFFAILAIFMFVIFCLIGLIIAYFTISSPETSAQINLQAANEIVVNDPTRINPPDWAKLIIVVGIFTVVGILGLGIIGFLIYIAVYFYTKKYKKYPAVVHDDDSAIEQEDAGFYDMVSVSIDSKGVVNEKE